VTFIGGTTTGSANATFSSLSSASLNFAARDAGTFTDSGSSGAYWVNLSTNTSSSFMASTAASLTESRDGWTASLTSNSAVVASAQSWFSFVEIVAYTPTTESGVYSLNQTASGAATYSAVTTYTSSYTASTGSSSLFLSAGQSASETYALSDMEMGVIATDNITGMYTARGWVCLV
jgi:hypothetical protein